MQQTRGAKAERRTSDSAGAAGVCGELIALIGRGLVIELGGSGSGFAMRVSRGTGSSNPYGGYGNPYGGGYGRA